MSEVALIAKITAQPGQRVGAVHAFQPLLEHARKESGTMMYLLHEDVEDADVLWMYEIYTDSDARDQHRRTDVMRTVGRALSEFLAGPPEITVLNPIGGYGR